jgi:hypothetical protein
MLRQLLSQSHGDRAFTATAQAEIADADDFIGRSIGLLKEVFATPTHVSGIDEGGRIQAVAEPGTV